MIEAIKNIFPVLFYVTAIVVFFISLTGRVKYGIILLIFLAPLQNIVNVLHQFPAGKDINDIILIGICIGWFVRKRSEKKPLFEKTEFNGPLFFCIIFTYFMLWRGSFYLGVAPPISSLDPRLQDWKNYMLFPMLYFVIVNNINDLREIKTVVKVMIFSMLVMDYYTIQQITWMSGIASRVHINGTFGSIGPNSVAAFYATYTFVLLGILIFDKSIRNRLVLVGVISLNLFCVLFIYSRGAYVAILAGLLVFSLIKYRRLLIPLLLLSIFWQSFLPANVVERIKQTEMEDGQLDNSSQTRLDLWKDALDLSKQTHFMGLGHNVVSSLQFSEGLRDTHNIYMKILVEDGVVGLLIILYIFGLSFKNGWRLYKTSSNSYVKGLGLGFAVCVISMMTVNVFGDRWTHFQLGSYYWIFLGLVMKGNVLVEENS